MKVILVTFLFFALAWANLSCNCGWRNTGRIVGGKEAGRNQYPWMVAFQTRYDIWTFCGGAIVTPWHIVTAAHCVEEYQARDLAVVVGAHDVHSQKESTQNRLFVDKIIVHPLYDNSTLLNDIAIIVTSTEIKYNKNIGPACMPSAKLGDEIAGQMLKAIGWGRYDPKKPYADRVKKLKEVDLEIVTNKVCRRSWSGVQRRGIQICTYSPRKDTYMKVILVSFLFFGLSYASLSCSCGWRNTGRIVGGKEAGRNEYPWMVAFQTRSSIWTFCGGAIVTPWHIVTAAHCVEGKKASDLAVVVGAHDVHSQYENTQNRLYVDKIIMHPLYNDTTMLHDLAILVTSSEIKYNKYVGPACMPSAKLGDEMAGQMLKAIGWGRYDPSKPYSDRIKKLKEVDLEIVTNLQCRRKWGGVQPSGIQICTYTPRKDTCNGDSGGPLTWLDPETNRFTLVGAVSYGAKDCGNDPRPGVNTNVSAYLKWINDIISSTKSGVQTCHKV
nr:venom serine protease-like [Halyomorpha halys]